MNDKNIKYSGISVNYGLTILATLRGSAQSAADYIQNATKEITESTFFSNQAEEYAIKLKELAYRMNYIAFGDSQSSQFNTENKEWSVIDGNTITDEYSLEYINFSSAIKLCDSLKEAIDNYDKEKDIWSINASAMKIFEAAKYLDIKTYEEKRVIETQKARYEAMTKYYAAQKEYLKTHNEDGTLKEPSLPASGDGVSGNTYSQANPANDQFTSSKTDEDTNTGKTDTDKSDDNSSSDTGKTEPTKDTDTKDSDKTFENKPKPDNPPTISDNKGSSGVSHGGLSSNNGNGNYTFTNSGISASQDEPIEILTDEKPGDDQITSLPDDNEDIYTIPTDLSGVTSTKKHSSGGGSGVIPILGGLGAAAAVGVGAKIYMDNKKNNDNDEDSSESDDNTEDWNETSNENDGIIADEWNGDDSNFEFDDSEPNMDDDGSGFSEI